MKSREGHLSVGVYGARGIPSTYSGYETFLTTLLPELVDRGMNVTMYCRAEEGMGNSTWQGVRRSVLPSIGGKNTSTLSHGLVAAVASRRARHDVVLVVNVSNALYCALGRYSGQPVVLNTDGQEWLRGKWGRAARGIFHGSAKIAGRCATALVADCEAMAEVYRTEFGANSTVIPYCVPLSGWQPDPSVVRQRGLEPGKYCLIAGRLNPENNIDRIAHQYASSTLELPLVILGAANYESPVLEELKELARRDSRIRILGHVDNRSEFFNLLHHGGVYLHGHSVGGTNPSLVEAMGVGARICAFDTQFSRETLGDHAGYFALEPSTLASTISAVLSDSPGQDLARRTALQERAADRFSTSSVVDAYEALLREAAEARKPLVLPTRWSQPERELGSYAPNT